MSDRPPYRYRVTYEVHREGLTKEEIAARDERSGGSDALVLISILHPPDGSKSTQVVSIDGRTNEPLDSREMFVTWAMMASMLAERKDLDEGRQMFATMVFESIRSIMGFEGGPRSELGKMLPLVAAAVASIQDSLEVIEDQDVKERA